MPAPTKKKSKKKKEKTDRKVIEVVRKELITDLLTEVGPDAQLLGAGGMAKQKIRGVISTQAPGVDAVIGRGGIPLGRLTLLDGPEGCIAGGSFLPYEVWSGDKRINHKGGTIRRLFERFKTQDYEFYVKSVDDEGKVVKNRVLDVVDTGINKCFKLELSTGEVLFSTSDHKYMTPDGFVELSELKSGSIVFIHNNTRVKKEKKEYLCRPEIMVKYHPFLSEKKVVCKKTGSVYIYYRGRRSRFAYEAHLNRMSLEEFINNLNIKTVAEIDDYEFIPDGMHIHHKDENFFNDEIDNLELVSPETHGFLHAKDNLKNLSFVVVPSEVISVRPVGVLNTYDVKCARPYNNYIAEGIVVHNCGKTTLALHIVAECQRRNGVVVYIDSEYKLDVDYAEALGVDIDRVILSQPSYLEKMFEMSHGIITRVAISRKKTKQRVPILIVLDSMNALITKAEYRGKWDDDHYAPQARVFSKLLPKLIPAVSKQDVALLFISQIRKKIGVAYGNDENTAGGYAPRFYASVILKLKKIGEEKVGSNTVASRVRVQVPKNQIAPPFRKTECKIRFGNGIDRYDSLIWHCEQLGIIKLKGPWYSFKDNKLGQGMAKAIETLKKNRLLKKEVMKELRRDVGW